MFLFGIYKVDGGGVRCQLIIQFIAKPSEIGVLVSVRAKSRHFKGRHNLAPFY